MPILRNIITTILILTSITAFSQNEETLKLLKKIDTLWHINSDGYPEFTFPLTVHKYGKEEVCKRVRSFMTMTYSGEGSSIDLLDEANGLFKASATTTEFFSYQAVNQESYRGKYKLTVEVQDTLTTMTVVITDYLVGIILPTKKTKQKTLSVKELYPVKQKTGGKTKNGQAFYYLYRWVDLVMKQLENKILL